MMRATVRRMSVPASSRGSVPDEVITPFSSSSPVASWTSSPDSSSAPSPHSPSFHIPQNNMQSSSVSTDLEDHKHPEKSRRQSPFNILTWMLCMACVIMFYMLSITLPEQKEDARALRECQKVVWRMANGPNETASMPFQTTTTIKHPIFGFTAVPRTLTETETVTEYISTTTQYFTTTILATAPSTPLTTSPVPTAANITSPTSTTAEARAFDPSELSTSEYVCMSIVVGLGVLLLVLWMVSCLILIVMGVGGLIMEEVRAAQKRKAVKEYESYVRESRKQAA